ILAGLLLLIGILVLLLTCLMLYQAAGRWCTSHCTQPEDRQQLPANGPDEAAPEVNEVSAPFPGDNLDLECVSPNGSINSWTQAALAMQKELEREQSLSSSPSPPKSLSPSKWKSAKKGLLV